MSTYEAGYESLLQGVSQQQPSERLPGQLTAQVNMVSDPVTNLRRRPGVTFRKSWSWSGADSDHILAWFSDLAGGRVHILLNTVTGNIRILNEDFNEEASLEGGAYLTSADSTRIRASAVGNEFFLANCDKKPTVVYEVGGTNPANAGFFYVTSGAFGKTYTITVNYADGAITASYTTPGGTGAGDAALSTPEYIAGQLATQLKNSGTGGSSAVFTDVRLVSYGFSGVEEGFLERNTGTLTAPVWVTVTNGTEMTADAIANGYLRYRFRGAGEEGGELAVSYQVKVNGAWVATVFDIVPIPLAYRQNNATFTTAYVPVSIFTGPVTPGQAILFVAQDGPYVYISRSGGISVSTNVGTAYLIASRSGFVMTAGELPARLPNAADGYICRVGSGDSPQYYRWDSASGAWLETAKYGSPTGITNVPISVYWTGTEWALNKSPFEGRLAGDDKSSPIHEFMTFGITGLSTYQGRLVLMSGPLVSLSAANKPRRFFRSTVTNIISSDPIEIGSGLNSAAAYEWAIGFQKDLILFSRMYQAVLPSGNAAVTPNTATVVPTSGHEVDTTCGPINLGRTLMYCNPRSETFFGAMEMIPSQYTDSQYVSQDATPHLPKYMGGRCRFAVSSGVASMAMFAPSGYKESLVVHEYQWSGENKVQQAWHQWTFDYPVAQAYYVGDVSVLVFVKNNQIVLGTVDALAGAADQSGIRRPFLDLNFTATITANTITLPAWLLAFDPTIAQRVQVVSGSGALAGEPVGIETRLSGSLTTVRSWDSGVVVLGLPYHSGMVPTPPQATDYQGKVVHSGKATLHRFMIGTRNSSDFNVTVSDAYAEGDVSDEGVLTFSSPELELGRGLYSNNSVNVIPCRTDMRTTAMEVYTEGTGELNITSLEYVAKFHPKIKRR